jgi:L-alanine-DL-glutamate epimerase-like enolase superfamily enzyme
MALSIKTVEVFVYRLPIDTPVQTSFGIMHDRPAVFVRVTDQQGMQGYGEIWCNFPTVGAEHRARLARSIFAPMLEGATFASPEAAFLTLTAHSAVRAIQSAEPGPIAQCIAGIDTALWDLHARHLQQPLWRVLGGHSDRVPVYASGLNPTQPEQLAAQRWAEGYRAFKLKIGFGADRDVRNLSALREVIGAAPLMVDANQAWDLSSAITQCNALTPFELRWIEEPLRADRPWSEWQQLARLAPCALAAGENIASFSGFDHALEAHALGVVQPDLAKWGGLTGCLPVAKKIIKAGARYCPHYLGAGIGLVASAHLLAAVGGDGQLEVDANPNPLRQDLCGPMRNVSESHVQLGEAPGLGFEPDFNQFKRYRVVIA